MKFNLRWSESGSRIEFYIAMTLNICTNLSLSVNSILSLNVLVTASVSISNTENGYLENMISRAIAMAKQAPEDEFSGLAEVSQYASNFNIKNFN